MKSTCDTSQLSWQSLSDDDQLAAANDALLASEQIGMRLVARPTNEAARKTIEQHFAKDRLRPRSKKRKAQILAPRGGRLWEDNARGSAVRIVRLGDVCVIPRDLDLIRSLSSIRRFVEVAPA